MFNYWNQSSNGNVIHKDDVKFPNFSQNAANFPNSMGPAPSPKRGVKALSFVLLYKTYVRCHMEYCVQAWNPYYRKDINILVKIQRCATKMVPELRHLSYNDILKRLKLTSLEDRRQYGDL